MNSPLTVFIAPDIDTSFHIPQAAGQDANPAPWSSPPARIACVADWLAFRGRGAGQRVPVRILAAHRLGLRVPSGMAVVASVARECAATAHRQPWSLVLTAAAWQRLQHLASLHGSPWPPARVETLASGAPSGPLALAELLAAHDHAGEAESTVRLALAELLAHGELSTGELAEILRLRPDDLRMTLEALQVQGLTAHHAGLWRIADSATGTVTAWLARIHLPT